MFGEPETVFTTEGSQEERERRSFGLRELSRGSVVRCWHGHSDFSEHHFEVPQGLKILESVPKVLLDSDFLLLMPPTASHFEDFGCQIVSVLLVPKHEPHKWIGPATAQQWRT